MTKEVDLIAIPKSEYDFLLYCKKRLIELHDVEIQNCYNEMQSQQINSILQILP